MPIVISKKAQSIAKKFGMHNVYDLYALNCGSHSGIPLCCILFWVKAWQYVLQEDELRDAYTNIWKNRRWGYIPCPRCLVEKKIVKIKSCKCKNQRSIVLNSKVIARIKDHTIVQENNNEQAAC